MYIQVGQNAFIKSMNNFEIFDDISTLQKMTHDTGCFYDVAQMRILKSGTGFKLRSRHISQSFLRTGEVSLSFASNILPPCHQ